MVAISGGGLWWQYMVAVSGGNILWRSLAAVSCGGRVAWRTVLAVSGRCGVQFNFNSIHFILSR